MNDVAETCTARFARWLICDNDDRTSGDVMPRCAVVPCGPCKVTGEKAAGRWLRQKWLWVPLSADEHDLVSEVNRHVLWCNDCGVQSTEQQDKSHSFGFRFCKSGSECIDAVDEHRRRK